MTLKGPDLSFYCPFCFNPVNPEDPYSWQKVTGWERRRAQGGTNAIALRAPLQEWAHPACVSLAKDGHLGQPTLFETS